MSVLVTAGVIRAGWCQQEPIYQVVTTGNDTVTRVDSPLQGQKVQKGTFVTHQTDHLVKVIKKQASSRNFVIRMETDNNAPIPPLYHEDTKADGGDWSVNESHIRGWVDWRYTFQALKCGTFTANARTYFQDPTSGAPNDLVGSDSHTFQVVERM